uniref:NADH-ubiquinone oxidoreductase chain 4 n=1 Tax=Staphylinidae sp. BMNH 1274705 TaxID=1796598 RepID=A0A126TG75_9COLE|nr:NADH dehydrogenase subunit 4 [Staphylinidae sp. BMNH 1274705]
MMKFMLMMLFMIPLVLYKNYWLNQILFFMMVALFLKNFSFNYMIMNISYIYGCDLLSYMMILLSLWICSLMILASYKIYMYNNYYCLFIFTLLMLLFSLYMTFSSLNLFIFYLFFEMSLIPTLMLIIGWGYQPERIQAGVYLLFYTMFGSLPMMLVIFMLYNNYHLSFYLMNFNIDNLLFYFCMNIVFLVKIPMYMFHLWLPKAHVEAPVSGSMILAGIMLKLGGYGMLRLMVNFQLIGLKFNYIFVVISLLGGVYVSLICIRQTDMKCLVAYSSVAHMGLVLAGIMTYNYWGMVGSLVMMIAHGLCSSALFCLVNLTYERVGSRNLYLNKGMINIMPSMSLWWFMFCACNMAAPPSLNLLGEIMLINSLISWCSITMVTLMLISFFSAVYSLFLYSYSQHGKYYSGLYSIFHSNIREYILLFLHWLPLNILILKSD